MSLQTSRNMRVQRPLNHRSGWPGDWCALDIATTPEQTSHVLFKLTEFHRASSASSPRVLRKVIPASSDENRGQDLMVNTKLTLLATARNITPGGRQCGSSCGQRSEACVVSLLKSTCCELATPPSCGDNATRHQRATTSRKSDVASPLKKTVRSDKTVACPLWYRGMHSSRTQKGQSANVSATECALKSGTAEIRTVLLR